MQSTPPSDWILAPNIHQHPDIYEKENIALLRDGALDTALKQRTSWTNKDLLDLGCGTGFWLPHYAKEAANVIGIEPDPDLLGRAQKQSETLSNVIVKQGSAEHIPLPDGSVDIVHARFAYFFGEGAQAGLKEVKRVLKPQGTFIAIDNSWCGGEFASLLEHTTIGNGAIDSQKTDTWWASVGAQRITVQGGWQCQSPEELETILRIEFPAHVVDHFIKNRTPSAHISYHFALFVVQNNNDGT